MIGQKIRQKKICTKYQGVLIDEHLFFKDHNKFLKQKLNKANGILAKPRHHLPSDILKIVYMLLSFWCTSTLCMSGLGTNNSDILAMVQRAQNKALRIISFNQERHQVHFYTLRQRYLIL